MNARSKQVAWTTFPLPCASGPSDTQKDPGKGEVFHYSTRVPDAHHIFEDCQRFAGAGLGRLRQSEDGNTDGRIEGVLVRGCCTCKE